MLKQFCGIFGCGYGMFNFICYLGTIALCAGCDVYKLWASVIVGALSGPLYLFGKYLLLRFRVDDPLDAIPVHGGGGLWGLIAAHIFM